MVSTMGSTSYKLPRYVAVQVTAERWVIAELNGEPDRDGFTPPAYKALPGRLSQGDCNNRLSELQRDDRTAAKSYITTT